MRETARHLQAYEYYYALGPGRTLAKVADHFKVTPSSVTHWSKTYNWDQRIKDRELEVIKQIQKDNDKEMIKQMASYKELIKISIIEYAKNLRNGKIQITKVSDFARLVELELKLNGLLKDTSNKDNEDNYSSETKNTLNKIFLEASRFGGISNAKINDKDIIGGNK